MCKESKTIIKNCIYEQITSFSIYLHQRDWQEFMTYLYNIRIRLSLNTGDRAGYMYDKAHVQQQQQRGHANTPWTHHQKARKLYPKNISHNINHALVQYIYIHII